MSTLHTTSIANTQKESAILLVAIPTYSDINNPDSKKILTNK